MDSLAKLVEIRGFSEDPQGWLKKQCSGQKSRTILLIADDAVGFGYYKDDQLLFDSQVNHVMTKSGISRLQQLYLFNLDEQVFIWQANGEFLARKINDVSLPKMDEDDLETYYDEIYYLWGDASGEADPDGFTLMEEAERGFRFKIPISLAEGNGAGIKVRHYFGEDADGQKYIAFSRLIELEKLD